MSGSIRRFSVIYHSDAKNLETLNHLGWDWGALPGGNGCSDGLHLPAADLPSVPKVGRRPSTGHSGKCMQGTRV